MTILEQLKKIYELYTSQSDPDQGWWYNRKDVFGGPANCLCIEGCVLSVAGLSEAEKLSLTSGPNLTTFLSSLEVYKIIYQRVDEKHHDLIDWFNQLYCANKKEVMVPILEELIKEYEND